VKVIVNSGVYRESVTIGSYKTTSATLTLQAAVAGKAINTGGLFSRGYNTWLVNATAMLTMPQIAGIESKINRLITCA
jgi:hypothetical protein